MLMPPCHVFGACDLSLSFALSVSSRSVFSLALCLLKDEFANIIFLSTCLHFITEPVRMEHFREVLKETGEFGFFQKALIAALCVTISFSILDLMVNLVFTALN